jgi:hypothetical protein
MGCPPRSRPQKYAKDFDSKANLNAILDYFTSKKVAGCLTLENPATCKLLGSKPSKHPQCVDGFVSPITKLHAFCPDMGEGGMLYDRQVAIDVLRCFLFYETKYTLKPAAYWTVKKKGTD